MTTLIEGQKYTGTQTFTLNGQRGSRTVVFVPSSNQEPEPFGHGQVRVFRDMVYKGKRRRGYPLLVLADSIEVQAN